MKDLVSIIIPIYKVEKYMRKCVDSIINQTYKNLEIILVDDGSPDKCAGICDEYEKKDKRIKVVHKKNGGLSSARNAGLDICTGEYICFVDSDDYIEDTYIESLYVNIRDSQYDFVACNFEYIYENGEKMKKNYLPYDINMGDKENLMKSLFEKHTYLLLTVAWNKIYRRKLFSNLRYTEGIIHEDEDLAYKILDKSNSAKIINKHLYKYLQRGDSIMGETIKNIDKSLIILDIYKHRHEYLKNANYSKIVLNKSMYNYLISYWIYANKYYKNGDKQKYKEVVEKVKNIEKSGFKILCNSNKIKYTIKRTIFKLHI